jgi:hypothetical protein
MVYGQPGHPQVSADHGERSRYIDSVAWALFFIFVGVAMLAQVPWGWFLVGIGVVTAGAQIVRWQTGLKVESFWVACAAVFLAGGVWDLLTLPLPLAPVLLIALGVVLLGRLIWR